MINDSQHEYYAALKASEKEGKSTRFIKYMLSVIDNSLNDAIAGRSHKLSGVERIRYFLELTENQFSRRDYMLVFKTISTATASRDLQQGVELGILRKTGTGNKTKYKTNEERN